MHRKTGIAPSKVADSREFCGRFLINYARFDQFRAVTHWLDRAYGSVDGKDVSASPKTASTKPFMIRAVTPQISCLS